MKKGIKRHVADLLDRSVNNLSTFHKRLSCILFGVLMGIVCLAQVIRAITEEKSRDHFNIQGISIPKDTFRKEANKNSGIANLKALMDSLKDSATYDSLRMIRPGLIDSANALLENN